MIVQVNRTTQSKLHSRFVNSSIEMVLINTKNGLYIYIKITVSICMSFTFLIIFQNKSLVLFPNPDTYVKHYPER